MHNAIFFGWASCWELIDQTNQPLSFSQCGNRTSPYLSTFSAEECLKKLWRQWWWLSSSHRFHWLMKNANMVPPISICVKRHVTLASAGAQWMNYHHSVAALKSAILILLVPKWCVRVSAAFVFYKVTFDPFFSQLIWRINDNFSTGGNTCSQQCFFGRCNMKCLSSKSCYQSCVWKAKCHEIMCTSSTCNQVCANCTMVCPEGVENCRQMCLGGECHMKCFARNCVRQCFGGKCNSIGHTTTSKASLVQGSFWTCVLWAILSYN